MFVFVYVCVCECVCVHVLVWGVVKGLRQGCECMRICVCVLRNSAAAGKNVKEEEVGSKCVEEAVVGTQSD